MSFHFSFFRDMNWNIFVEHIPVEKKNNTPPLKNLDIWKAIAEQYVHVWFRIRSIVDTARKHYNGVPFVCMNIDLYVNRINSKKFLCCHISLTGVSGKLTTFSTWESLSPTLHMESKRK
jgi:hypothetical protein